MHKIKEMLMNELYQYEDKAKRMSGGTLSAQELEHIHKLTDTVKNIDKIEMFETDDGYSGDTDFMGEGKMYGTSYARGRRGEHYVRGHYSRDGMRYDDGDTSYARKRDSMGRYSRDDAKKHLIDKAEEMLEMADSEKERKAIHHFIKALENE